MSTKKKLIVSISSLCVVVVLAIITLVAVFAAGNQRFESQVSVTYKATNVSATISGDYLRKDDSRYTSMGAPIEFLPTTETGTRSMGLNGLELNEVKNYAILRYTFTNNSSSVRINVESRSSVTSSTNTAVTYAVSTTEITNFDTITKATLDDFTITYSGTTYVYIKIKIADLSNDSSFNGSFGFDLSKTE